MNNQQKAIIEDFKKDILLNDLKPNYQQGYLEYECYYLTGMKIKRISRIIEQHNGAFSIKTCEGKGTMNISIYTEEQLA